MTHHDLLLSLVLPITAGLVVGFCAGLGVGVVVALRWLCQRPTRGDGVPIYTEGENPTPGRIPWRGRREHLSIFGWCLAIAALSALLVGSYNLYQNNQIVNRTNQVATCLSGFVTASSAAQQQRSAAYDIDRQAIREQRSVFREFDKVMIDSVTNPPADQAAARADFLAKAKDWDARLAHVDDLDRQAEQQRRNNPLPPQPNC